MTEISQRRIALGRQIFLQCPLFAGLAPDVCEKLFDIAHLHPFEKGDPLYKKRNLCFLLSGSAKVLSQDGCMVMRRMQAGEFFGAAGLFCTESEIGNVTASSPGILACIDESYLRRLMEEEPQFAVNYICFLSGRIRFLNDKIFSLTGKRPEERVLYVLQNHADADGCVNLPFSMGELANRLHIGRSSLYRAIDRLVSSNQIERKNHLFYIKGDLL
ncbi:MAG: Crp/Fnr family transcriptional regulator [Clostridia bacterium]|nr:Crp/Fnr family transcriptional regulator [Clostridia bacterium]MBQ7289163.1 Crp/Fnr family transcriptional regulator [Clostridia bacterium]